MTNTIKLISCEGGDYSVLEVGDEIIYQGTRIPDFAWIELLNSLGHEVKEVELTDEEMEEQYS